MQTLAKWNYEKHEYEEYEVPSGVPGVGRTQLLQMSINNTNIL